MEKGDLIELKIEDLTYGGRGIAKHDGMVVFIPNVVPGDIVEASIQKKRTKYAEADCVRLIEPSVLRVEPRCPLHGICGGCVWQNIPYEKQLIFKESILSSTIEHIAKISDFSFKSIIPSPEVWYYRNKMEFAFGRDNTGEIVIGLHRPGSFYEIFDVPQCFIHPQVFDQVLKVVRDFARKNNLHPYNTKEHTGFLRHLVLRYSHATKEVLVVLITAESEPNIIKSLGDILFEEIDSVKGFMWALNTGLADIANAETILYSSGKEYLYEEVGKLRFKVSAFSFFQTNTAAAERLFETVKEAADLTGDQTLLDAYCGTGSIGLYLADRCKKVYGVEVEPASIWDARFNARLNSISNCMFFAGDIISAIPLIESASGKTLNRLVIDPPRSGMDKKSLRTLIRLDIPHVVYVSCNPTTLARDLQSFADAGYTLRTLQPVDMFPHTYHIESVATLSKNAT